MIPTIAEVKANLILTTNEDDTLIQGFINAAISYAEDFQHLPEGYYTTIPEGEMTPPEMSETTRQAVIIMASSSYESRDGGTGGFFADNVSAAKQSQETVDRLLRMRKEWRF